MATAAFALRRFQLGWETTLKTAVAATRAVGGDASFVSEIDREDEPYPNGNRLRVAGNRVTLGKGGRIDWEDSLNLEEILYPLETGLEAVASGVDQGSGGPYLWSFNMQTGVPTLKSLTAEYVVTDGSTDHFERKAPGLQCPQFSLVFAARQRALMRASWFTGADSAVVAGTPARISGRTPLPAGLFQLSIDDLWSELGDTPFPGVVRAAELIVPTGIGPDHGLTGNVNQDYDAIAPVELNPTLSVTIPHNAGAANEVAAWRDEATRFIRLVYNNGAATTAERGLTVDMAARWVAQPEITRDGETELISGQLELVYDPTGTEMLKIDVLNGMSALQ